MYAGGCCFDHDDDDDDDDHDHDHDMIRVKKRVMLIFAKTCFKM